MRLVVGVIEARNLPAMDPNGYSDPYVKVQVGGKQKHRTKVVKKSLNPWWGEELCVRVDDLSEELVVSVLDEDRYFNDGFVGQVRVPVSLVFDSPNSSLGSSWYPLQPKLTKKSKPPNPHTFKDSLGEILLNIRFSQTNSHVDLTSNGDHMSCLSTTEDTSLESSSRTSFSGPLDPSSPGRSGELASTKEDKVQKTFAGRFAQMFNKNCDGASTSALDVEVAEPLEIPNLDVFYESSEDQSSSTTFEDLMKSMESKDVESPSNLPGGILVDQSYIIAPRELNSLIFSPDSTFPRSLAEARGNTDQQFGPWRLENGGESLKRVVTYVKAPTKLIKAVKAYEDQTYLKADGRVFAILVSVNTPDVMYGSTFRTELLYCIFPGPELPSGELTSQLVISWRMNFLQSTMMKGMIENGARQGLKDSFEQFSSLLSQTVKVVDPKDMDSSKGQVLDSLQAEPQSDWKLAAQYLANFTVASTVFMGLYVLVHIWFSAPSTIQGLEFVGLDLPDSIGEFVICGVLVLQAKRVLQLLSRFVHARMHKGNDKTSELLFFLVQLLHNIYQHMVDSAVL